MSEASNLLACSEGMLAYAEGDDDSDNPYARGTDEHYWWDFGWNIAAEEDE